MSALRTRPAVAGPKDLRRTAGRLGMAVVLVVVAGYVVADRLFAYVGIPLDGTTLFVGEIAIAVGLATFPFAPRASVPWTAARGWTIAFLAWATFVLLIRWGGESTIDSIRDFSFVYYVVFALFGYRVPWERLSPRAFGFIAAVFIAQFMYAAIALLRLVPGAVFGPFGDMVGRPDVEGATLSAGAAYFLFADDRLKLSKTVRIPIAVAELTLALLSGSRAVLLCVLLVVGAVLLSRRGRPVRRPMAAGLPVAIAAAVLIGFFLPLPLFPPYSDLAVPQEAVDVGTVFRRTAATFPGSGDDESQNTSDSLAVANVKWRLEWWSGLAENSWERLDWLVIGRGFGPNLATEVGYVGIDPERPLRAPHNIAVDVFARLGVIGLVLWLGWTVALARVGFRASTRDGPLAGLALWMFVSWLALLSIAMFGVVLESPFAAAPFYFLTGGLLRLDALYRESAVAVPRSAR